MFSFRGRISRLSYFVQGFLALPGVCAAVAIVLVFAFAPAFREGNKGALTLLIVVLAIGAGLVLWFSLALQTKRIRDMGWDPLIVLPAWFTLQFVDIILVHLIPEWSLDRTHTHTALSVVVNLLFSGALLFWPSAADDPPPADSDRVTREFSYSTSAASAPMASFSAPTVSRAPPSQIRTTFGRR